MLYLPEPQPGLPPRPDPGPTIGDERHRMSRGMPGHGYLSVMSAGELYHDRWISCTDTELVIRGYYLPFGREKRIPYDMIRDVATVEMGVFTGKGRLWGTASPRYWAHLDPRRPRKSTALVLNMGRGVKPFITPDDPTCVRDIVESRRSRH